MSHIAWSNNRYRVHIQVFIKPILKGKSEGNLILFVGYKLLMESSILLFDYTGHSTATQKKNIYNNFLN